MCYVFQYFRCQVCVFNLAARQIFPTETMKLKLKQASCFSTAVLKNRELMPKKIPHFTICRMNMSLEFGLMKKKKNLDLSFTPPPKQTSSYALIFSELNHFHGCNHETYYKK